MGAEAAFSVTAKTSRGDLVTLRGDTWAEFVANADLAGVDGASYYASAFGGAVAPAPTAQQAVETVVSTFPGAAPLPQPGVTAQEQAASPGGNCAHGPRVWKDTQTAKGQWKRWECAIPWSKDAQGRCANVNVK